MVKTKPRHYIPDLTLSGKLQFGHDNHTLVRWNTEEHKLEAVCNPDGSIKWFGPKFLVYRQGMNMYIGDAVDVQAVKNMFSLSYTNMCMVGQPMADAFAPGSVLDKYSFVFDHMDNIYAKCSVTARAAITPTYSYNDQIKAVPAVRRVTALHKYADLLKKSDIVPCESCGIGCVVPTDFNEYGTIGMTDHAEDDDDYKADLLKRACSTVSCAVCTAIILHDVMCWSGVTPMMQHMPKLRDALKSGSVPSITDALKNMAHIMSKI